MAPRNLHNRVDGATSGDNTDETGNNEHQSPLTLKLFMRPIFNFGQAQQQNVNPSPNGHGKHIPKVKIVVDHWMKVLGKF